MPNKTATLQSKNPGSGAVKKNKSRWIPWAVEGRGLVRPPRRLGGRSEDKDISICNEET